MTVANRINSLSQQSVYPWIAIFVSALFLFYKYVLQVYPSVMTNELMQAFHVYGLGLGHLAATFFYSYMITQIFVGVLLDRYSPRYLSAFAVLIASIGALAFSLAQHLWAAEAARLLMGVGAAFATVSYMKIAAMWFPPQRFALVGGLLATAAMLGAAFGEAPLSLVVDQQGWRHALKLCAGFGLVIAGLFVLIIRDRHKQSLFFQDITKEQRIRLASVLAVLKNRQNWLLTLYSGLAFSPVAVFGGLWGNPFLQLSHQLSRTEAATLVSMVFIGLAIGGPVLGAISDMLGQRRRVMVFGTGLSLISVTAIIYWSGLPVWIMLLLLLAFGFGTGSFMLGFVIGRQINAAYMAATVIALINTGDALFGSATEPLIGYLLDRHWTGIIHHGVHWFSLSDYYQAFLLLPAYLLVACLLIIWIKEPAPLSSEDS